MASLPAGPDTMATTRGPGVTANPAFRIEYPHTLVRNKMLPSNMAKKPMAYKHGRRIGHAEGTGLEQGQVQYGLGVVGGPVDEERAEHQCTGEAAYRPVHFDQPQVGPCEMASTSAASAPATSTTPR